MNIDLKNSELFLRQGQPVRLQDADGLAVRCIAGTIWITSPGQSVDIFIEPGGHHCIQGRGLTLVESVADGRISLEWPKGGRRSGQWPASLAGAVKYAWHLLRRHPAISRTARAA